MACNKCGSDDKTADGRCRECRRAYEREVRYPRRKANPVQREKMLIAVRKANGKRNRRKREERLMVYGDRCEICGAPPGKIKGLHLDHNHTTGLLRGHLCARCNHGLHFVEKAGWWEEATKYIERYQTI